MEKKIILKKKVGDSLILFISLNGRISLVLAPINKEKEISIDENFEMDGLVQLSLAGDVRFALYSSGDTMRNSQTTNSFFLDKQEVKEDDTYLTIITTLKNNNNLEVVNNLKYDKEFNTISTFNTLTNNSNKSIIVEKFDSFSLSGMTPFGNGKSSYKLHKMLGNWSAEGRQVCNSIQYLGLEESWNNWSLRTDKIGAVGSMPIKKHFPFICLEDETYNTFWGVFMEAPYSWDIEVCRSNRNISISGGIADFEYAHIRNVVNPSESYSTTKAYITVCDENIDKVFNRLRNGLRSPIYYENEKKMPVIYNEYCATWGNPTHDKIIAAAKKAKEVGCEYFVIDSGWYCESGNFWCSKLGDYDVYEPHFKGGIRKTADELRNMGLIPGIWFEFECAAVTSNFYSKHQDWLLKKDGYTIIAGERAFLDFRNKDVIAHLKKVVIDFLNDNHFGYMKIDYNECVGIGIDGTKSLGAELQDNCNAFYDFVKLVRKEVKGIIIEMCSAGGHRLEPYNLEISDMESFSDAHECHEGAIVALDTNRLVPTYKNQIWGVVNQNYSLNEVRFSLAKTMYGRLCVSGDIYGLDKAHYDLVRNFIEFYKKTRYIINNEENYYFTNNSEQKYQDPKGSQIALKLARDHQAGLLIIHGFKDAEEFSIQNKYLANLKIKEIFGSNNLKVKLENDKLTVKIDDFDGAVIHLIAK